MTAGEGCDGDKGVKYVSSERNNSNVSGSASNHDPTVGV